jgi:DnaJ-class molecular chaperone
MGKEWEDRYTAKKGYRECPNCNGTGYLPTFLGQEPKRCPVCHGKGYI